MTTRESTMPEERGGVMVWFPRRHLLVLMMALAWPVILLGSTVRDPSTVVRLPGNAAVDLGVVGYGLLQVVLNGMFVAIASFQLRRRPLLTVTADGQVWLREGIRGRQEAIEPTSLRWSEVQRGLLLTSRQGQQRFLPARRLADPAGVRAWVDGLAGPTPAG